jgi:arylsulfatase
MLIRYLFLAIALVFLLFLPGCQMTDPIPKDGVEPVAGTLETRPNILLIVADDMGYTDIGSFGSEIPTPNLDALAMNGVRFVNFHAAPSCAPTRAMLMSGVTNREAGVAGTVDPVLSDNIAPLPALLQDVGYRTYMAGKWHLGHEPEQSPTARGFDASYALVRAGDNHLGASNFPSDVVAYRENGHVVQLPDNWFSTELYTDKLIELLRDGEGTEQPWFGYLAFTAPHWPLQAPTDWRNRAVGRYDEGYDVLRADRINRTRELGIIPETTSVNDYLGLAPAWESLDSESQRQQARAMELYAAMVENMDFHVGRIVEYLKTSNQFEETVILFFSDNGASGSDSSFRPRTIPRTDWDNSLSNMGNEGSFVAIGRGWAEATTAPYRNVKGSLYEGGTRAAAFLSHDSMPQGGHIDRGYLTVMDVLPTLLEIAGSVHPGIEFQGQPVLPIRGRSFWERAKGNASPVHDDSDVIPWMTSDERAALVQGEWKIVRESAQGVNTDSQSAWKLYHLADDPWESTDLSGLHPQISAELIDLWNTYRAGLGIQ